jgi:hypothetical protein
MAVGSLADAPKDLLKEIKELEDQFTIDTAKLKEITNHFVNELEKGESSVPRPAGRLTWTNKPAGLSVKGGSIVSRDRLEHRAHAETDPDDSP